MKQKPTSNGHTGSQLGLDLRDSSPSRASAKVVRFPIDRTQSALMNDQSRLHVALLLERAKSINWD